ncbi:MAG: hypothetical protein L6R42_009066, partial [Xanthoria sp. 1 TBL-2021]
MRSNISNLSTLLLLPFFLPSASLAQSLPNVGDLAGSAFNAATAAGGDATAAVGSAIGGATSVVANAGSSAVNAGTSLAGNA